MITYKSTRGEKKEYTFAEAILKGIANDGGLLSPTKIPSFTIEQLRQFEKSSYQERALFVFELFETGFTTIQLKQSLTTAYAKNFDHTSIAPVVHLKDSQYLLELWHGPTSAFKDIALQILPLLFVEVLKKENKKRELQNRKHLQYLILAATSGDTGTAALEGYKNKKNISIIVLYPKNRISKIQELQMITRKADNLAVIAVHGDFDATQTCVKQVFTDKAFTTRFFERQNTILSSANSINWGRIIPQIVYHISSYLDLVAQHTIKLGDEIDIAIPTGNFGNILAAYYAKRMGLPIRKFICASNENNALSEFLQTGIYDISHRNIIPTASPSIDILISSNIERFLYLLTNNSEQIATWMQELQTKGKFSIDAEIKNHIAKEFYASWVSNKESLATIKKIFDETRYVLDPHTAIAQAVTERFIRETKSKIPVVISATAHFSKFAKDVYKAITNETPEEDEFILLKKLESITKVKIPQKIVDLEIKQKKQPNSIAASKEALEENILQCIKNLPAL